MYSTTTLFVVLLAAIAWASKVPNCNGKTNTYPINEDDLDFVSSVPNGKLYRTRNIEPPINVIHVYGTPYEMGYAQGQMLKTYVQELVTEAMAYLERTIDEYLHTLPQWIRDIIEKDGFPAALELTSLATKSYTPGYFYEELKGLSDGSGMDYQTLVNIHMLPELIQAACTMIGSWGNAIKNSTGVLYQLRALDWDTKGPFQKWPAVIVYHPNPGNGHPFGILTFTGFIGALTGYSSASVGICEKVWLSYKGTQNRFGIPFHFLLRDILQFDMSVDDAINRIINAERTCSIHVGVGDPVNKFRAIEYSYETSTIYNDLNYPEYPAHPRLSGVVYIDKHVQPSNNPCLGNLMKAGYGTIDSDYLIHHVAAEHQTGDTHAAVYDYANHFMYAVIASPYLNGTFTPAYDRQWTRFNMTALFNEMPPKTDDDQDAQNVLRIQ